MSSAWIETKTGKKFFPLTPLPEDVDIEDIAHALSNQCRFSGHTNRFYSVAQHSVLVADCMRNFSARTQLLALLHDAPEAYLVDMPSPIKALMPQYIAAEKDVWTAIKIKFDLVETVNSKRLVKEADLKLLKTECRDFMKNTENWSSNIPFDPLPFEIVPMLPASAKTLFVDKFEALMERRKKESKNEFDLCDA